MALESRATRAASGADMYDNATVPLPPPAPLPPPHTRSGSLSHSQSDMPYTLS